MAKELIPILFSCVVWSPVLSWKQIEFKCDNHALVEAINKGSFKDSMVMHLLRSLWFFTAYFDISIWATHLPGGTEYIGRHVIKKSARVILPV